MSDNPFEIDLTPQVVERVAELHRGMVRLAREAQRKVEGGAEAIAIRTASTKLLEAVVELLSNELDRRRGGA